MKKKIFGLFMAAAASLFCLAGCTTATDGGSTGSGTTSNTTTTTTTNAGDDGALQAGIGLPTKDEPGC